MTVFIGDVHGKYDQYKRILAEHRDTIQVGDMGVGFRHSHGPRQGEMRTNPPYDKMVEGNHRFIRGNHDNPEICRKHTQCIKDGTVENDIMFIGGGLSIDKQFRIRNYSWWPDEELSEEELQRLFDVYCVARPKVMVTHECPQEVAEAIIKPMLLQGEKIGFPSRTRNWFQSMLEVHKPKLWIHGHWHVSKDHEIKGTRFICLAELEAREIPLD